MGVRWLFPGELGEDVPQRDTLRVSLPKPVRGAPSFAVRSLGQVEDGRTETPGRPRAAVLDWMRHARLNTGLHPSAIGYGHAWDDYLKPADLTAHPEWKPSTGEGVRNGRVTYFCTTAPGVVETFAQRVIESLDRNPLRGMASISPTDGGGFCKCGRCAKLLVNDLHGKPGHAPAILLFFKQVAEIVARERPGRRLGGYAYYNYAYPPPAPPKLPDNFSLCWAPLNYYGYGLLKPVYRDEFERVLAQWSRVSQHFCYNNHSTWMRSYHGAPLPLAFDVLKLELPAAARSGAWAARLIGTCAWGVNAPLNFVLARQMWNARLDVSAELDDWLARAYGPGWTHMRRLYDELDARMTEHKKAEPPAYKGSQYEVNEPLMRAIYAPLFPAMEQHCRATLAACATDAQRRRLAMFGDNLVQLHFALRKAGTIAADGKSIFHRDDAAFAQFLKQMENTFSLYRDDHGVDHGPIWETEYRVP